MKPLIIGILTAVILSGCQFHPRLNYSKRLIDRPDFHQASQSAPEWCRDALKTINALELENERK